MTFDPALTPILLVVVPIVALHLMLLFAPVPRYRDDAERSRGLVERED